ncbi:MAG TPA: hypothetical protein VF789_23145 [Thermoanaerobaculia bacterium]
MKITRTTLIMTALVVAALLTGCGSTGILGGGNDSSNDRSNDPYADRDRYGDSASDVRGTVESVDTLNRRIVVDSEGTYRNNLRNGDEELVLYYDDRTTVAFQGQTYRPEDLERGDRIAADVDNSGNRMLANRIDVLYDVTSGNSDSQSVLGSDTRSDEIRGFVRYIDTNNRTLEIEPRSGYGGSTTGRSNVVVVHYDSSTTVEFQGRRYQPENLERGDEVEIDIRDQGGRLIAEDILVVADSRSTR